jgi:hypothetical protein
VLLSLAAVNSQAQLGQYKGPHPCPGGGRILQVSWQCVTCCSLLLNPAKTSTPSWGSTRGPTPAQVEAASCRQAGDVLPVVTCYQTLPRPQPQAGAVQGVPPCQGPGPVGGRILQVSW